MAELVDQTAPAWKGRANEALARFNALPNNKKILFFTAIAAVLSIALALLVFNREPPYKVLFTGLADSDGGQVTAALQQMNVPYQLGDGGVISVPSERVYDTRLKLATQGLPKAGGVGFELMDKQKFGISQFAEQVNYQRSIEGELARTIEAVAVVESARVHLAMPKQFGIRARPAAADGIGDADPAAGADPGWRADCRHHAPGVQFGAQPAAAQCVHRRSGRQHPAAKRGLHW